MDPDLIYRPKPSPQYVWVVTDYSSIEAVYSNAEAALDHIQSMGGRDVCLQAIKVEVESQFVI